jgi:hypothetical protein
MKWDKARTDISSPMTITSKTISKGQITMKIAIRMSPIIKMREMNELQLRIFAFPIQIYIISGLDILLFGSNIINILIITMLTKQVRNLFSKSEPTVFLETVTSTVKGYLNPNYVKEFDTTISE